MCWCDPSKRTLWCGRPECHPPEGLVEKSKPYGVPRRIRLDLLTPAELAVYEAVQAVERLPAHPALTEVVCTLQTARERLADYVDAARKQPEPIRREMLDPTYYANKGDV